MSLPHDAATFGDLLRAHRLAAGVTQDTLSERAGLSPRSIQKLEAGVVRPRRSTAVFLADALGLAGSVRDDFVSAAVPGPRRRASRIPGHASTPPVQVSGREHLAVVLPHPADANPDPTLVALPRSAPSNVPWPVSSLIGRDSEAASLGALISDAGHRLVTLTGVGGAGKTRLATRVAGDLLPSFPDGVWFVELAPVASPTLVPRILVGVLGARELQDVPVVETLVELLRRKRALLVLDNCEHVIDACAELAHALLGACPDLQILATSREPFQLVGERLWQVQPLALPDLAGTASVDAIAATASIRLFVERAQDIDATFSLTAQNASAVAQVCARLDGIPLAIELAASRIRVLTVEQIAAHLDDSFRVLSGGARRGPTRQQTMQGALNWSYDLLTDDERAVFQILSVFAGGFDLEAAEQVMGDGGWVMGGGAHVTGEGETEGDRLSPIPHPPSPITLDLLGRLVDKSLVVADTRDRGRRYRLLEPVRQYAAQSLRAAGQHGRAHTSHAAHYTSVAARIAPLLGGPEQVTLLQRLDGERDNLRAALAWTVEHGSADDALRLAAAMAPYWEARGHLSEGRRWLETVLGKADGGSAAPTLRMRALSAAGALAYWQRDLVPAETLLGAALAAARALADRRDEALVLAWLAGVKRHQDATDEALAHGGASLRLGQELGDEAVIATALYHSGTIRFRRGEPDLAAPLLEESLARFRRLGDTRHIGIVATMLARGMIARGTLPPEDLERVGLLLGEGVPMLRAVGDQSFLMDGLGTLARLARAQGRYRQAARWMAAGLALRQALGMRNTPRNQADDQRLRAALQGAMTEPEFAEACAAGTSMSLDQLLADLPAQR
jgi:non-specific serine/threonine protein kinase